MKNTGIYIHIPFCKSKCPYCDFYSVPLDEALADRYTAALTREISSSARDFGGECATVYVGGGTPSVLGEKQLSDIFSCVRKNFRLAENCEVTCEANPADMTRELAECLIISGVNRLSMGVQSGVDSELSVLGRRHDSARAEKAVAAARDAGFDNISLDLMTATPGQTEKSLSYSIDFLSSLSPRHISSYILKIEDGTPFAKMRPQLSLPDEDGQAQLYLKSIEFLEKKGYHQYEISNFSQKGFESRHNLGYWNCLPYFGFGPAAHGFIGGRRYYYPRDIESYIERPERLDEGEGGTREEYAMLRLRLTDGLTDRLWRERFGEPLPHEYIERARKYIKHGLVRDRDGISFTPEGFLLSNPLIAEIIY